MTSKDRRNSRPAACAAEIVREYGPFAGADKWPASRTTAAASGPPPAPQLVAFDPAAASTAHAGLRSDAGTAFDGKHLYQIADRASTRSTPPPARCWHSIPAPGTAATRA
jgi:hypothetical protein